MAKIITVSNAELLDEAYHSSLSSSPSSGSGTLSVYSISNFAVNQCLLIGELGQEGSEIIKTHAATAPTGTTVTLSSNLVKSHPKDAKVYIIPYDQVQFYYAATASGSKTLLSTSDVDEESMETIYKDTTYTSGYYFTRFYNSISGNFSDYSDPIPYGGFSSNTVGYIINMVMTEMKKEFSSNLTYEMLINEINSCLRYVRGKLKRWSNVQEFNYELDSATVLNDYTWTLPTTYYDKNSNRSCLNLWIEGEDTLIYVDKEEFDDLDRDSSAGKPKWFTINDGSVYVTPKVGADYVGKKFYMDFYTDIVEVDSDSDEITLARHDMVKHWLKWQVRNITERNGQPEIKDGDWIIFSAMLQDAVRREGSGQKFKLRPQINGITYRQESNSNFDTE